MVGCWSYINVHGCLLYLYKDTLHKYLLHTMACKMCNKNFYFWFRSMQKFIRFDWWELPVVYFMNHILLKQAWNSLVTEVACVRLVCSLEESPLLGSSAEIKDHQRFAVSLAVVSLSFQKYGIHVLSLGVGLSKSMKSL